MQKKCPRRRGSPPPIDSECAGAETRMDSARKVSRDDATAYTIDADVGRAAKTRTGASPKTLTHKCDDACCASAYWKCTSLDSVDDELKIPRSIPGASKRAGREIPLKLILPVDSTMSGPVSDSTIAERM